MSSVQDRSVQSNGFQPILCGIYGGICYLTAFSPEDFSNLVALQKGRLFGMTGVFVWMENTGDEALVVLISAFLRKTSYTDGWVVREARTCFVILR